jgi:hypothetical protein
LLFIKTKIKTIKREEQGQAWWLISVIPLLGRQRSVGAAQARS